MAIQQHKEIEIQGLSGSDGIVIGSVLVLDQKKKKVQPQKIKSGKISAHFQRFVTARTAFLTEIEELADNLDQKTASILETQKHIVSDLEIEKAINTSIEVEQFSVDYSIYKTFNVFIERLRESGSELFQQRIIDIENIRDRLISLSCDDKLTFEVEKGAILIVKDISPTDLVSFYEKGVTGLVMDKGGVTSHAAIIAQSLNIPCIVSTKIAIESASSSKKAILDASEGVLYLNPSKEKLKIYKKTLKLLQKSNKVKETIESASKTSDGEKFTLRANIEFEQELELARKYKANGIGLLRTEALLFTGITKKSEAEQDIFYENIVSGTKGEVTIRLFDVGGDKLSSKTPEEDNPFLGWRGIRMLLDETEMFTIQLRSILKVAGKHPGKLKILVPMVSVLEEVFAVKEAIKNVQTELNSNGFKTDNSIPIGVMIEVPSAALIADHLAKEVDFFSIGTNDLTQYTMAVDRGNERICKLYQHAHPAVWKLIKLSKIAAEKNKIGLSVCGELAGDVLGAACLIGMGITDLSMSPSLIPKVKYALINRSSNDLKNFSNKVLECSTSKEVHYLFDNWD